VTAGWLKRSIEQAQHYYARNKAWCDAVLANWRDTARRTFTCEACGSGPWDIAWDPHEQPVMGRRGGRICPNCSGAD